MIRSKRSHCLYLRILAISCILGLVLSTTEVSVDHSYVSNGRVVLHLEEAVLIDEIASATSSYDYGTQVGRRYYQLYRLLTNVVWFDARIPDGSHPHHQIEELKQNLGCRFPDFLEELQGLADGARIPLDRLIAVQLALYECLSGDCTILLATGNATRYNQTFLMFNLDASVDTFRHMLLSAVLHRLFSLRCRMVRINTLEYRYVYLGIPILYEMAFLNEKGLGWGSPGTLLTDEDRPIDEGDGIATMLLEKLAMMTCKNVTEVALLYKNIQRASQKGKGWFHQYDGSTSCFCDNEGGILAIEQTHHYIMTVFGSWTNVTGAREGVLWHANHHQWLDPNLTGSIYPVENPSSALRAERSRELLEKQYGTITVKTCKEIVRDHGGGSKSNRRDSGDICRHPDRDSKRITAFSWIILPKDMTVYVTHGSPCKSIFWRYDFSAFFT